MHADRLLVVSAQHDMQKRLGGVLVSAGFEVAARNSIDPLPATAAPRFDCTMLDATGLSPEDFRTIAFCIKCHPVILLAERPAPWLSDWIAETLSPQANDDEILAGVRRAIAANG